jgi:hypothetical protein
MVLPQRAGANGMTTVSECLSKAAEFESRVAITSDPRLKATFKDLARFYRQLAKHVERTDAGTTEPPQSGRDPDREF